MAWLCPGWKVLENAMEKGKFHEVAPLGGSIGKDGDCLLLVGVQNDQVSGPRAVRGSENALFVIQQMLISVQARIQARWCVALAKDYIPSEHCVFQDRMGRQGRARYCLSGSPGSHLHWRVGQTVSHIRALVPKRVVVGFKSYHEQIHSPSAFQYNKEYFDELRDIGLHRDRDSSRLVAKLLVYTGSISPQCSGINEPRGACMGNLNSGPDIMALVPNGSSVPVPAFHEAILASLVKKQVRRLFVAGIPLEEDVIDTAVMAKERNIASDVYIVLDACRAEQPENAELLDKIAKLVEVHGLKVTTFRCAVLTVPKLMHLDLPSGGVLCYPHRGQGDYADLYSPESSLKDQPEKVEKQVTFRDAHGKQNTDLRGSSAETILALMSAAASFREYIVQNDVGEWDHTVEDAPQVYIPAKYRLGYHLLLWLGRDETKSTELNYGVPGVVLRTRFPTGLSSLTMVLGGVVNQSTNKNADPVMVKMYGPRSFQLTCEAAMGVMSSCGFMTQHSALTDIRRVLQKIVTPKTVCYYLMRIGYSLKAIIDPAVDLSSQMVLDAEKSYATTRAGGTDEEKAEALWRVDRMSEQAADWKAELFTMRNASQWVETKREKLADGWAKREYDDVLQYTLAELSTFCCTAVEGYVITQSTETETNQLETNKGGRVILVTAAAIDFTSRGVGPVELGKYFHGEGVWLPRGHHHMFLRLTQTWRSVLAICQQYKCSAVSLSILGESEKSLSTVPDGLQGDVVMITLRSLFKLLEEPWGFGQVYLYGGRHLGMAEEEARRGYKFLCSVVVHGRDPKGVCKAASLDLAKGTASALLCCGSAESVMLGVVGGHWEKGTADAYSSEEDMANNTTILLSHVGARPKGLESETVYFHTDDTPVRSVLGPPGNKPWSASYHRSPITPATAALASPPTNALSQLMRSGT